MKNDQLVKTEREIRQLKDYEKVTVFDYNGKIMLERQGSYNKVEFTQDDIETMKKTQGAVLTHNHPGGWRYNETDYRHHGNTFSLSDVKLAALARLSEIRAVTPTRIFSLKTPREGWGEITEEVIEDEYNYVQSEVRRELLTQVREGILSLEEANFRADDMRWRYVARNLGLIYNVLEVE